MPIQFRCSNIVSYDSETQSYLRCDHELTAPESDVAKFIRCPKCSGKVLVPLAAESPQAIVARPAPSPTRDASRQAAATAAPPAERSPTSPTPGPISSLPFSTFDARHRCNRCGGNLDENYRCVVCGHRSILDVADPPLEHFQVQPAGCQLWLGRMLAHGIAANHLILASHSLVAIVLIILITAAVGLGGGAALFVLAAAAFLAGLYGYIVFEFRRITKRPAARLNWWQQLGWNLVLHQYRSRRWRPSGKGTKWKVLDLKCTGLDDQRITSLPDITTYHVIDLEGTSLTDAGLRKLQGLKGLQRLVVRRTNVTQKGVFYLQQRLPQVWIWN